MRYSERDRGAWDGGGGGSEASRIVAVAAGGAATVPVAKPPSSDAIAPPSGWSSAMAAPARRNVAMSHAAVIGRFMRYLMKRTSSIEKSNVAGAAALPDTWMRNV